MPDAAASKPSLRTFAIALSTGLLWGIGVATFVAAAASTFAALVSGATNAPHLIFETGVWTAMVATILALFPIGPVAGVLGWLLYHHGVVARSAYAAVGAVSALAAPVLILLWLTDTARYASGDSAVLSDGGAVALVAAFPVVGAFSGFMAARVLRRGQRS